MLNRLFRAALLTVLSVVLLAPALVHAEAPADQRLGFDVLPRYQSIRLRLDPGMTPGISEIDSIEIANAEATGSGWASAEIKFKIEPAIPVDFQVRDLAGLPTMAAFVIRDSQGRIYPMQSKRLEPDFYFQPQIYRADGETESLPAGTYTVTCSRGPESVPETQTVIVSKTRHTISYNVQRWVNPMARGWFSGDSHIHGAGCLHLQ